MCRCISDRTCMHFTRCHLSALLLALVCATRAVRAGAVFTTDGKFFEGKVALTNDHGVTITSSGAQVSNVPLDHVTSAAFDTPRPVSQDAEYLGPLSAHTLGSVAPAQVAFTHNLFAIRGKGT